MSLFIAVYTCVTYSQTPLTDSLKKIITAQKDDINQVTRLRELVDEYRFSYPDSALLYAQKALNISEKLNNDSCVFWSIVSVGGALYVLGDYNLELEYAFKASALSKKLNTPYSIGYANGLISDCYFNMGEYDTCMRYWREVIKIGEQALPGELSPVYGNASHIFAGMGEYDSALIYATRSYELFRQASLPPEDNEGIKFYKSNIYTAFGDALAGKACYDSALYYYRISLPYAIESNMDVNRIDAYNGIANVYKKMNNNDSAIYYAKKVLTEKITKSYPVSWLKAVNILAGVYEAKHNTDSALKYMHVAVALKDSLFNREKTMAFQHSLFKQQEKQKEIEAATTALRNRYIMYFLIALFIVLVTIAAVFIRNKRTRQLQNIRNSIADDLHDDIGSALSSISIMSELAKKQPPKALSLLTSIGENTVTMQENMSDIIWTIKSGNDRFENVLLRMNQFASELLDARNIDLEFHDNAEPSVSRLTMEQRKNFYLFFKEVINNAAKYSEADKVTVNIIQKDHTVEMTIVDNGKGFDTSGITYGNGMDSLKKRAAALNGDLNIISSKHEGTTVKLKFKIT
jgi:two-component system sensor histidine kinase UhpB